MDRVCSMRPCTVAGAGRQGGWGWTQGERIPSRHAAAGAEKHPQQVQPFFAVPATKQPQHRPYAARCGALPSSPTPEGLGRGGSWPHQSFYPEDASPSSHNRGGGAHPLPWGTAAAAHRAQPVAVLRRNLVHQRRNHAARAAPGRPEVNLQCSHTAGRAAQAVGVRRGRLSRRLHTTPLLQMECLLPLMPLDCSHALAPACCE